MNSITDLDPGANTLDPGLSWKPSQTAWAWLRFFMSRQPDLDAQMTRFGRVHPQFSYVLAEMYGRLYQRKTPPRTDRTETTALRLSRVLHGILDESDEWLSLLERCDGDALLALAGLSRILEALEDLELPGLPPVVPPPESPKDKQSEGPPNDEDSPDEGETTPSDEDPETEGESSAEGEPGDEGVEGDAFDGAPLRDWLDQQESDSEARAKSRASMTTAAEQALELAQAHVNACADAFGDSSAEVFRKNPEVASELLTHLQHDVEYQALLKRMGRWLESMRSDRKQRRLPAPTVPMGATLTGDVRALTNVERALLVDPDTEDYVLARLALRQASGWERGDMQAAEQGGVYILLDVSGSMETLLPEAKAFAVAAAILATRAKREVIVAAFNTAVYQIPFDGTTHASLLNGVDRLSSLRCSGGTSIMVALSSFLALPEPFRRKADILLVSDGCSAYNTETLLQVCKEADITYIAMGPAGVDKEMAKHAKTTISSVGGLTRAMATAVAAVI